MRPTFLPTCPRNHTCTGPGKRPFDILTSRHLKNWTKAPGLKLPGNLESAQETLVAFTEQGLNVGVRAGDGILIALDVDSRGQTTLDALPMGWDTGVVHETPRGTHILFRYPKDLKIPSTRLKLDKGKHLEVLSDGRFMVTPPSPGYIGDLAPLFDPDLLPEWPFHVLFSLGARGVQIWNKTLPLEDPSQSGYDMALANQAATIDELRDDPDLITGLIIAFRKIWGASVDNLDAYLERTTAEALKWGLESKRARRGKASRAPLDPQEVATRFVEWVNPENLLYSQGRDQILVWPHKDIETVQRVLKHYPLWTPLNEDSLRWVIRKEFSEDYPALTRMGPTKEVVDAIKGIAWNERPDGDELLDRGLRQRDYIFSRNPQGEWVAIPVYENTDLTSDVATGADALDIAKTYYAQIAIAGPIALNPIPEDQERWRPLVREWVDEHTEQWLASWIGYLLVPDTSWQKILVMLGPGANGKSIFLSAVRRLLGDQVVSAIPLDELGRGFSAHHLERSLANLVDDLDLRYIERTGSIKTLVAGEPLRAEIKFGPVYWFRPVTRLVSATNQMPQVSDTTHGWVRRLDIVPFERRFVADPVAHRKILYRIDQALQTGEIGYWALKGYLDVLRVGRRDVPQTVEAAVTSYTLESDSVKAFVFDCLRNEQDKTAGISTKGMYAFYAQWAREQGIHPVGRYNFNARMKQLGFKKQSGKRAIERPDLVHTSVWVGTKASPEYDKLLSYIGNTLV